MFLLLDTSTPACKVSIVTGEERRDFQWQADRELAKGLLKFLKSCLEKAGYSFKDINGLGVFEGPGSFTGLRIGITVMNTLADGMNIPICGAQGEDWANEVVSKLNQGKSQRIILPHYGSPANVTKPRK